MFQSTREGGGGIGVNRCGAHDESPERPRCIFIVEKLEPSKREEAGLVAEG